MLAPADTPLSWAARHSPERVVAVGVLALRIRRYQSEAAPPGLVRHVIRLPEQPEPDNLRVEIIAGRSIEADCNVRQFAASISEETVPGWGRRRCCATTLACRW